MKPQFVLCSKVTDVTPVGDNLLPPEQTPFDHVYLEWRWSRLHRVTLPLPPNHPEVCYEQMKAEHAQQQIQPAPPSRIMLSLSNVSTKNINNFEYIYFFLKSGFWRCWHVHTAPRNSSTVVLSHKHRSLEKGCGRGRSWAGVSPAQLGHLHLTPRTLAQPPLTASHEGDAAFAPDNPLQSSTTYKILKVVPKLVGRIFPALF